MNLIQNSINFKNTINYEKVYYYISILFSFSLPLSKAGISIATALFLFTWLLEGNFQKKYKEIQSSPILLSIFAFVALCLLSISWSQNLYITLQNTQKCIYWLIVFVIATSLRPKYIHTIITTFLIAMFISEIIAYGVFFEIWNFKNATPANPTPFMYHTTYSVFMAFTSILLLNRLFLKTYSRKEKILLSFFFLTVTGNLFLSIGRTGQLALIFGIIVLTIIHFRLSFKSFLSSILIVFIIFFSAYHMSESFQNRIALAKKDIEKILKFDLNSSWGIRVAYWISSANIAKENPLFGVGLGDYIDETKEEIKKPYYSFLNENTKKFMSAKNHPHNQYLLILLQMGVLGLILFLYIIYLIFRLKIYDQELKQLSILFATIFIISFLPEALLVKHFSEALFLFFLGLFSVFSIQKNQSIRIDT